MGAVLFDFPGTLFRVESAAARLRAVLRTCGGALPEPDAVLPVLDLVQATPADRARRDDTAGRRAAPSTAS